MIQRNKNFWTNDQGMQAWTWTDLHVEDPSALIKCSDENVRIMSWCHAKYLGKLKWDRVHSMLIHLSGSTAPHEKPSMSPHVSSMWGRPRPMKKICCSKASVYIMHCVSSLSFVCNFDCEAERVSTLIFLCILLRSSLNTSIWTDLAKPGLPCVY